MSDIREFLGGKVLIVLGPGGVGKTTISAALGITAARLGLRTLILTIDPAKRLADALGAEAALDEPYRLPRSLWSDGREVSDGQTGQSGELFAMMLDQKLTFDRLIDELAPSPEKAEQIRQNQWYQQMSSALVGAQEYMAISKLYEMIEGQLYDLIVLDTPPTSNVLDFLEAPDKIRGLLQLDKLRQFQNRLESTRAGRLVRWSGGALLKFLGRVTGQAVMEEIFRLIDQLSILSDNFEQHSSQIKELLNSESCRYVQVAIPTRRSVLETLFLRQKLKGLLPQGGHTPGVVVNRVCHFIELGGEWRSLLEPSLLQFGALSSGELLESISLGNGEELEGEFFLLLEKLYSFYRRELDGAKIAARELAFLYKNWGEETIFFVPKFFGDISDFIRLLKISRLFLDDLLQRRGLEILRGLET